VSDTHEAGLAKEVSAYLFLVNIIGSVTLRTFIAIRRMLCEQNSMRIPVHCLSSVIVALVIALGLQPIQVTAHHVLLTQNGKASHYGKRFHGKKTASGETFNQRALVAAHPSWPFGTIVRVTNIKNGHSAKVRIVDRGPAKKARRRGIIIDLSTKTARMLGFHKQGRAPVRLEVLKWGKKPKKR
jgi:rare lipoprotein A